MTHQLDDVLKRLVNDSRADAALVWCRSGPNGVAVGLGGYPMTIAPTALLCLASTGVADDAVERTSSATVPVPGPGSGTVPGPGSDALMQALPAAPAADRSFVLGEDLVLTVVWCDQAVASGIPDRWQPDLLEQVAAVASVCRDLYCANGEVERLRAAVNGLQDGVVTLNPGVGLAAVNRAAATLLGLPQGKNPVAALDSALDRLAGRALNCSEINDCRSLLESDPEASIACMWRFPTEPTHLWVVSKPVDNQNFHGRTWVFYDESESSRALGSSERAHAQLRASADAMLDPQALLEAVRDESGLVVDFVYRDVNRATCAYLSMTRDELVGHAVLETMPNLKTSGMLARYAHCVETGDPLILDDIRYDNEVLSGPRHYDIRGAHAGAGFIILTWRDVTERVQSAQRIAESEEHYRLVADNVGDVVMHIRRGAVAWVSPSVEEALGAAPDHWIGRPLMEIIPEEDHQAADKVVWLADDRAVIPCGRLKAADGQTHWVHVHAKSFYDADGNPDGYTASFRVIDDEVRAVEQVELADQRQAEADARYRRLMDSSAVPMCVTTPEGRFEVVNDAMCRYFGYDAEVLRTKTWPELAAPEYLDSDVAEFARIIAGESETHRGVKEYLHADGHRIWGDLSVSCLRKPNGEVESIIAQIIDITERVRTQRVAEDARRMEAAARARYRNLMDNAAVGMGVIEPDGRLEEVNQAACDFFGYDAATLKQMTWQQLTAPEYLEADFINVENMMAGRIESFRLTKQFIHANGHLIWGDLSVGCLRKPNGDLDRMIAQVTDITLEVEAREYLARRDEQNRVLTGRLQAKTDRLAAELRSAAAYVESILPNDVDDGPVRVSARYLPSRELGGDCFDYRWVDDDHFIAYVIDVSGHGIEASLVSISVHNLLRSSTLPESTLLEPAAVLSKLNDVFTMERHSDNYLTIWYGVYQRSSRTLNYASGGHPPGLLVAAGHKEANLTRPATPPATQLATGGFPVGMFPDGEFSSASCPVPPGSQLLLYSDGAYELPTPEGSTWSLDDLMNLFARSTAANWSIDTLTEQLRARAVNGYLDDDCSLIRLTFS